MWKSVNTIEIDSFLLNAALCLIAMEIHTDTKTTPFHRFYRVFSWSLNVPGWRLELLLFISVIKRSTIRSLDFQVFIQRLLQCSQGFQRLHHLVFRWENTFNLLCPRTRWIKIHPSTPPPLHPTSSHSVDILMNQLKAQQFGETQCEQLLKNASLSTTTYIGLSRKQTDGNENDIQRFTRLKYLRKVLLQQPGEQMRWDPL